MSLNRTTQQRIVDASLGLFATRGYHGTGIRHIAEAAGISTASLYHYMGTKEDLILHLMREGMERLRSASRIALATMTQPAARLVCLARVLVATEATYRLTIIADTELRVLSPAGLDTIMPLRDEYSALWASVLDSGESAKEFQLQDSALVRISLLQMCTAVANWYYPGGRLTLADLVWKYGDLALTLVGAHDGDRQLTSTSLQMHEATKEIEIVGGEFATYCSPEAIPNNLPESRRG